MNSCFFIGRVGNEPQITEYKKGKSRKADTGIRAYISIAIQNRNDNDNPIWLNLVAFGKTAEFIETYVEKGKRYAVECEYSPFSDSESGKDVPSFIIRKIHFADGK